MAEDKKAEVKTEDTKEDYTDLKKYPFKPKEDAKEDKKESRPFDIYRRQKIKELGGKPSKERVKTISESWKKDKASFVLSLGREVIPKTKFKEGGSKMPEGKSNPVAEPSKKVRKPSEWNLFCKSKKGCAEFKGLKPVECTKKMSAMYKEMKAKKSEGKK